MYNTIVHKCHFVIFKMYKVVLYRPLLLLCSLHVLVAPGSCVHLLLIGPNYS